ncbi:MAG TPA: hypothetical protein VG994_12160 [Steroidobacteraceae bacterium]|jgi:hypothetical protein|nr:hypothetical protein [Steroidobacteraceae bacterium]
MEGLRQIPRVVLQAALLGAVLALPAAPALTCDAESAHAARLAGEGKQSENPPRDKCKRAPGAKTVPKGCPDGGERLPNDNSNKRSPLDDAPPLAPLVA